MAETIAGLVEYAELNDSECLAKRLEVLRHPSSARLGPPDLCYVKKRKVYALLSTFDRFSCY